ADAPPEVRLEESGDAAALVRQCRKLGVRFVVLDRNSPVRLTGNVNPVLVATFWPTPNRMALFLSHLGGSATREQTRILEVH
ncbi:MAG: hypothetical protein ACYCW6_29090, partial [Candidatus Xenobia bacterium]